MIRISDMTCGYGGRPVLSGVSLDIEEGTTTMLTGPNGAGKSTFLRVLAGVLAPTRGTVDYGWPGERDPRRFIGFLPDSLSMYGSLSVAESTRIHQEAFGVAPSPLTLPGKASISDRTVISELSMGQRVIFQLALLLSTRPRLILLDEVLHSVDPYLRAIALEAIVEAIADSNPTVVMVNLNYHETAPLAERVVFLGREGILLDEPVEKLGERSSENGLPGILAGLMEKACEEGKESR
ncbi:MAG: ATP-binding cassette domain-containing protein [Candidatus Fermentibacteraceae bacterium]